MGRRRRKTPFHDWVYGQGTENVADALGVSHWTVLYWLKLNGYPKIDTIARIIKLSKGELTFEKIMQSFKPVTKKPETK